MARGQKLDMFIGANIDDEWALLKTTQISKKKNKTTRTL